MATLIPALSACRRMTPGERRFAQRLIDKLEDDYLCWYDVPLGRKSLHPDFVLLNPRRGLLILEVKDWSLDAIKDADRASFTVELGAGRKVMANPLEQARQYAQTVVDVMQKDAALRNSDGGRYHGRLCFPYGYGVVLTNIRRQAFEHSGLANVLAADRVICQDEMLETVDAEELQKRLWAMFTVSFKSVLSLPQVNRIRWHLFPEIRVQGEQLSLIEAAGEATADDLVPDLIRVMDLQQEQLARNLGEGHRVIHGVAGSGKTMILGYRCEQLASALQKPVLVLCFNVALASKLAHTFKSKGLSAKIQVRTFHSWCRDQLVQYHVKTPASGDNFFDALAPAVIAGVEHGQIPRAQYGAILVDEGHDFQPEWLRLVAQMIDPDTNALLLLYDDAQSIYSGKRRKFSFSSLGIQAKGRTTILRLNYRNTDEVLRVAFEFAREYIAPEEAEEDGVPLVQPQSAGRRGDLPILSQHRSLQQEAGYLAGKFIEFSRQGRPWREMAVLHRARFIGEEVTRYLREAKIPVDCLGEGGGKNSFNPGEDSIKVMTLHSSKGLEFPVVGIPGLGHMPYKNQDPKEEAKLLYVGMTRAMDTLLMTCHRDTDFVARIRKAGVSLVT